MERQTSGELNGALEECIKKLSGDLELGVGYHQFGDTEQRFMDPAAKEYFIERGKRIIAGEDVWMARDLTSQDSRTFDFFSGAEKVGSLSMDLTTNEVLTHSRFDDVMYEGRNLVEAVDSIEGQLSRA